jgi:26S proteasome regulatory subunit N1
MVSHPISKYASITITSLAYSSSGNVLKVQELLGQCLEHLKDAKDSDW